ncbi:transcription factor, contains a PHD finger motif [Saitoella coloradoensis]
MTPVDETAEDNNQLFRFSADYLRNRRNFWYMPCVPAPLMPSIVYSYTEVPPYGPRINWHDMSPAVLFDKDGLTVTTDKGFRMTRANVMLREGSWYFECKVLRGGGDQGGHVRVGLARREASQEGPVGADGYSYGLRDQEGQKVHLSRPRPFMNESFGTGDVIGIHVHLPTLASQYPDKKVPHPFRHDRYPIRWKGQLAFELPDYSASKAMDNLMDPVLNGKKAADPPTLPGSFIKVYKNGKPMGMAFENLFSFMPPNSTQNNKEESIDDGMLGYYPAVSVFRKGMVKFNFGPNFDASPEDGLLQDRKAKVRAVHERFDEQIAEDVTWDIVDEVIYSEYDATEETATGNAQANLKTKGIKTLLDD